MNTKNLSALALAALLLFSSGCGANVETIELEEPSSLVIIDEPSEESEEELNIIYQAQPPSGMLLPFDEGGSLIWSPSDTKNARITFTCDSTSTTANLKRDEDAKKLKSCFDALRKTLVAAEIIPINTGDEPFAEFNLTKEIYSINLFTSKMDYYANIYKSGDCAYMKFKLRASVSDNEDFSLFRLETSEFEKLEKTLDSFEKETRLLMEKPVLYLYPRSKTDVSVQLNYKGRLTTTYPAYDNGWSATAFPDGRLINKADNLEYSYLYWEGLPSNPNWWNFNEGYCVSGANTASFLQKTLSELGLTPKEYNEFIVYWLPQMQDNPYNLISFQWENYEELAPLDITPKPNSILRVFMVFKPLASPIAIKSPKKRASFSRKGFTVVEWGASEVR